MLQCEGWEKKQEDEGKGREGLLPSSCLRIRGGKEGREKDDNLFCLDKGERGEERSYLQNHKYICRDKVEKMGQKL